MSEATTTTDHDEIRRWAEERGGRPAVVRTGKGRGGILRFDFGEKDEKLEEVSWEEFFAIFDENGIALLHQDATSGGQTSRFFKFVARPADTKGAAKKATGKKAPAARSAASKKAPAAGKTAERKPAAKAAAEKKPAAASKASSGTKSATKKAEGEKKPAAKKATARKPAAKKPAAKKTASKG